MKNSLLAVGTCVFALTWTGFLVLKLFLTSVRCWDFVYVRKVKYLVCRTVLVVHWKAALETCGNGDDIVGIQYKEGRREEIKHLEHAFHRLPGWSGGTFLKAFICDVSSQPLCTLFLEMVNPPDVQSPALIPLYPLMNPGHTQQGFHLIEFPWSQWTHTQDPQVPVLAFDKQMTPMELRSEPAKTWVRQRKNKVLVSDKPNIDWAWIESNDVYPACVEPLSGQEDSRPTHMHTLRPDHELSFHLIY